MQIPNREWHHPRKRASPQLYEFFVEANKIKNIPVIVLPDSSVLQVERDSASVDNGDGGAGDDNGDGGEDMFEDENINAGGD